MSQTNGTAGTNDGKQGETPDVKTLEAKVQELQSNLSELTSELETQRNVNKEVIAQRDKLKNEAKTKGQTEKNYEELWNDTTQKLTKAEQRLRENEVKVALTNKLSAAKVQADKIEAALELAVKSPLIEWDAETGVKATSITAAVQELGKKFSWLFETKVTTQGAENTKNPQGSSGEKTMKRADFNALPLLDQRAAIKAGTKITD